MDPSVSIIVPVYNAEGTLRRCVESVLTQEFTDFELILANVGSQDASGAPCDQFARSSTSRTPACPTPGTRPWT